jgi:subfamily B ATP-binding cassette protein HlyB/CyaB
MVGEYTQCNPDSLLKQELPAVALGVDGHAFILAAARPSEVLVHDPATGQSDTWPIAQLAVSWSGNLLVLRSARAGAGSLARFDFTWFIPALVEHRKWLAHIAVAALALQLFALMSPLFFQAVMDKVLLHRNLHTLDVLVLTLVVVALLESVLSTIRTYILEHTAARIDAKLGSQLYRHLLALPLAYFQARQCGHLVARLGGVETLRHFLSAQTLGALIDTLFFGVFTAALFILSPALAAVVLCSLPLYLVLAAFLTPHLRKRLELQACHIAAQQAFLLETLRGIDTLKTLAAEPQLKQRWARLQAHTHIAINDPGAPLDTVVAAAQLAGAHEFILKLPHGYDTLLQEGGSSLSGGQRQRIALARTLFADPKILIMDEATSALDAEAEQHIIINMPEICRARTVLIIAHKARALKAAGRIVDLPVR